MIACLTEVGIFLCYAKTYYYAPIIAKALLTSIRSFPCSPILALLATSSSIRARR